MSGNFRPDASMNVADPGLPINLQVLQDQLAKAVVFDPLERCCALKLQSPQHFWINVVFLALRPTLVLDDFILK